MKNHTYIENKRLLREQWQQAQAEYQAVSYEASVQKFLARRSMEHDYRASVASIERVLPTVSAWNIQVIIRYCEQLRHFNQDAFASIRNDLSCSVQDMQDNTEQWLPLSDFVLVMRAALKIIGEEGWRECFDMGASNRFTRSWGPISSWVTFAEQQRNLSDSLRAPVGGALRVGVSISHHFNDTKDSIVLGESEGLRSILHYYKPWVPCAADWFSIPFTNGHFADIPRILNQPIAEVTDPICQWDLVEFLGEHGYLAQLHESGDVVVNGVKIAALCTLVAEKKNGEEMNLCGRRDFPRRIPFFRHVEAPDVAGGWLALHVLENFPRHAPVVWKGQIYNGPFHLSEFQYQEVPAKVRVQRLLRATWQYARKQVPPLEEVLQATTESALAHAQQQAEEKRKREQTEMMLQTHNRAISQIFHDTGNSLTLIEGGADTAIMLLADGETDAEIQLEFLHMIKDGAKMLAYFRDALLTESRVLEGKAIPLERKPVSIRHILEEGAKFQKPNFKSNRKISLVGDDLIINVGEMKLITVFMNLIGNALKYSNGEVQLVWYLHQDLLLVAVLDQGNIEKNNASRGISKAQAEQLFTPFGRLEGHANIEGTGLGLLSVKKIVETHGAEIFIEGHTDGTDNSARFTTAIGTYPTLLHEGVLTGFVVTIPHN